MGRGSGGGAEGEGMKRETKNVIPEGRESPGIRMGG